MPRFARVDGDPVFSEVKPEACAAARGPEFALPGESESRRLGEDPDMPPASSRRYFERPVNLGFAQLKGRPR